MDVVGAAIIKNGAILLVRTEKHPRTLIFPGGQLEEGETPEECITRELREELPGLRFRIQKFLGVYWGSIHRDGEIRLIVYRVSLWTRLDANQFKLGDEILEALWVKNPDDLSLAEPTAKAITALKEGGAL